MSLWLTYAWKDNDEGNFDYLVQELNAVGIETRYDKVAIIPGQRLWDQIANHISAADTQAWAYLITPNSLASQPCLEELAYAINRMLGSKNGQFPLIGLVVPGVSFDDIPVSLKVRLCVSLSNLNWKDQVRAALELRPPALVNNQQNQYIYSVTDEFNRTSQTTTIEIRTRFNEVHYWRVAVPRGSNILNFGTGPAGGGQIGMAQFNVVQGIQGDLDEYAIDVVGGGGPVTPGTSAYIVLEGARPPFVAFGNAVEAFGLPVGSMEIVRF